MGIIFSCCRYVDVDENDALLGGHQNGYGANNEQDHNELQRQAKEQEERALAREAELREIVSNTNDKLIDISMISNSGIVVPGSDTKSMNSENLQSSMEQINGTDNETKRRSWVKKDSDKSMSRDMKEALKTMHQIVFKQSEEALRLKAPAKLTATL